MHWEKADDIHQKLCELLNRLHLKYIDPNRIFCFRSHGSSSGARARIWSLPRVWQQALDIGPAYVIEVLAERFDCLSEDDQVRVLIHELLHIPKTFSGSLRPHRGRYLKLNDTLVEQFFREYKSKSQV